MEKFQTKNVVEKDNLLLIFVILNSLCVKGLSAFGVCSYMVEGRFRRVLTASRESLAHGPTSKAPS